MTLQETLNVSNRADFCVGYFNLRGWKQLDSYIEQWSGGEDNCCRLLVGMQRLPQEELITALSLSKHESGMDNQTAIRLKKKLAEEFREQLTIGIPTNEDEAGLRRLAAQIKTKKVIVKLFLRHPLHAKLYLLFRPDPINPSTGYLGSSNLTFAGLSQQGELNIDVLDHDACQKLARWFEDRWNDNWCLDISQELVSIIEESWAREDLIPPYYIYIKMAYHLAQEARAGLSEFRIPHDFGKKLFEFQTAAVKIAAHHLNKRGGVLIGDVVGLGKTLMATALARIFEDDYGLETLIICPKNLVRMWEDYVYQYRMRAKVLPITRAINELPDLRRYRLLIIDESHNLRHRDGKRYRAIQEYIQENECKCIMLSATPYNKNYLDLSNQLRLFVTEDKDLGIRPERLLREIGETEFIRRHQCPVRSLAAFEKSEHADDWRELMRLYMVRRTRSFIQENYAKPDPDNGRKFLTFEDGTRSYFPVRQPKTVKFKIEDNNPADQYARLYTSDVVDAINNLNLPRYGMGNYIVPSPHEPPAQNEARILQDLSRAGKRLMGFCRTNLFKRLESSGRAFIQSIERHILRNYIYLHAIENNKPIPIGTQDSEMLDSRFYDEDADNVSARMNIFEDDNMNNVLSKNMPLQTESDFKQRAAEVYADYETQYKTRFKWLRPSLFSKDMGKDLGSDLKSLFKVLHKCGDWDTAKDAKLNALYHLLTKKHPDEKVIVFSQFADTVYYLESELKKRGLLKLEGVTGESEDPTKTAWQFSPESNNKRDQIKSVDEFRVLIATDVLSEGQNLQDCAIIVNYDLPWAIIRLIQRAGRIDRIGQKSENIICYSFLPADGVERIIRLRARVRRRLQENAEVVGTDEAFFEDDRNDQAILDLYNEKSGILERDVDGEVDLASYAYQIWKNAITKNPELQKIIPSSPPVVYSAKVLTGTQTEGVLVYMKTAEGNDALAWIDKEGKGVTESQFAILKAAECPSETPAMPRDKKHHELVKKGVELIIEEEKSVGGQLGRPSGARFRTYERLKRYAEEVKGTLFESQELLKAIDDIYRYPLRQTAIDTLNRQLRSGISDETLAQLVIALRDDGRLCIIHEEERTQEPRIICSMGLIGRT
ncbi:MAG: NgoFVII family restriction endonuclease [Candidatus Schekmanbacteria bacterium RBG_16_38_10]|uniref:NgoFVII family restriction endonuclease n=1 Tax=Candidatus Schekmanbacteria bacterium RBG_16_38_10 TaxID=1817879 RepID=A0A1F7RTQ1_9BACT|nr:MAG: NgoFVII family restriction endonuclease [Candidatus Schekmanbacteria bacterium RBG_16_38_10]